MITANSPTHEKLIALIEVQTAIRSIELVEAKGLGTKYLSLAKEDLRVYEKQLIEYIVG